MLEFERTRKTPLELPLTAMIDVVFILIIFFMLTTSFMKMESMEVNLPTATVNAKKITDANMAHIYLQGGGQITYGQRPVDKPELRKTLLSIFKTYPDQRVVVLVNDAVSLQTLVDVMDLVYAAGGKNVFVKEWNEPTSAEMPELAPVIPALASPVPQGARKP